MSDGGKGKEILPDLKAQTRDIIGKELGVSGRQVDKLHAINEKSTPKTKQLVREGKLSGKSNPNQKSDEGMTAVFWL